jgi:outer membrane biosynthesis protein TonB
MDNEPKETQEPKQEPKAQEPKQEPKPEPKEPQKEPEGLTDKHGQEAVSKGKYERDLKAANDRIAELQAKIDEAAKTEDAAKKLREEIAELKRDNAERETDYRLKIAGCTDEKKLNAAKKLMPDYEGDIDKLKADYPYLFEKQKQTGTTGAKPEGASDGLDDELDKAFGLK